MTPILVTIASILALTGLVWTLQRLTSAALCPICLGVGGTWAWMLVARALGLAVDPTMLAILMGGSVAGVAYLIEKRLPPQRSALLWKTIFIPLGFVAAYALAVSLWAVLAASVTALTLLTAYFLHSSDAAAGQSEQINALTEKMKNCC